MNESDTSWLRLELLVEADRAVDASAILWDRGAAGVEVHDHETYADEEASAALPEGANQLIAYFEGDEMADAREIEVAVADALTDAEITPLAIGCAPYNDRSWETSWKNFFEAVRISPRVRVGPPWEEFEAPEGGTRLVIEPGMAFGTGTHQTTQMCAAILDEMLEEAPRPPSVLDVGCGSGILTMLASRLGAERVVGIDIDETAVEVAKKNLEVNDLAGGIELSTTPIEAIDESFDIVVANILAPVLMYMRDELIEAVAPGGALVLSGIDEAQLEDVDHAFASARLKHGETRRDGDWIAMTYRKEET
ncbi:MAG: 50S ribosomal protein L11 methyltransferase [Persicimonas sp.]